jgi:hypothetical protein
MKTVKSFNGKEVEIEPAGKGTNVFTDTNPNSIINLFCFTSGSSLDGRDFFG